jgi:hypothetical protein
MIRTIRALGPSGAAIGYVPTPRDSLRRAPTVSAGAIFDDLKAGCARSGRLGLFLSGQSRSRSAKSTLRSSGRIYRVTCHFIRNGVTRPSGLPYRPRRCEEHQQVVDFACTTRISGDRGVKCLFVLAEEVVVGSVRHEPLVTHIGGGGATVGVSGGRSTFGV